MLMDFASAEFNSVVNKFFDDAELESDALFEKLMSVLENIEDDSDNGSYRGFCKVREFFSSSINTVSLSKEQLQELEDHCRRLKDFQEEESAGWLQWMRYINIIVLFKESR